MTDNEIEKMLDTEYTVKLKGSVLGYVLQVLADEQRALNEVMADDITDITNVMVAAANDVAGNAFLTAVYEACGPSLVAVAMGTDEETMTAIMEDKLRPGKDEVRRSRPANKNLN